MRSPSRTLSYVQYTGAASGERAYSNPELRDKAPSHSMNCPKPMHVQSAANATRAGRVASTLRVRFLSCRLVRVRSQIEPPATQKTCRRAIKDQQGHHSGCAD